MVGVKKLFSLAYTPTGNNVCEGKVRLLKRLLKIAAMRGELSTTAVDLYVALAQSCVNASNLGSFGDNTEVAITPSTLVFGETRAPRSLLPLLSHLGHLQGEGDSDISAITNLDVTKLVNEINGTLSVAVPSRRLDYTDATTLSYDKRRLAKLYTHKPDIEAGSVVYYMGEGPFEVRSIHNNKVVLADANDYQFDVARQHPQVVSPNVSLDLPAPVVYGIDPTAIQSVIDSGKVGLFFIRTGHQVGEIGCGTPLSFNPSTDEVTFDIFERDERTHRWHRIDVIVSYPLDNVVAGPYKLLANKALEKSGRALLRQWGILS
ncbi:hypothetical protein FOZ61_008188 [Perkinsus olseni]|uniref:Uncharacterized protein n=1 Tax=Perkinsus olseni TaxID=32597 RepID=A0A7J6L5R3_PEROL|nr:hypothetical protein FOZ61_008188 [Perkinsus olseni]